MRRLMIFIIAGIAVLTVILGIVGFLVVGPMISASRAQAPTPTPAVTASPTAAKKNPIAVALRSNAASIQSQVAAGLKLSVSQLQADLKAGQTLTQIAQAQNVSTTQLQTILTNAVKPYLDQAVSSGSLTQQQENGYLKRLGKNPNNIDALLKVKTTSA